MSTETVYLLMPEMILVLFATAIYLGGAFTTAREGWAYLGAAGVLLAGFALFQQQQSTQISEAVKDFSIGGITSGPILVDMFSQSGRWVVLGLGLALVMLTSRSAPVGLAPEFLGSLLLILAGLMLVLVAGDLVLIFVGLELVSIPTYVLLYLGRGGPDPQEATTKYFFLSILSSAILLYGFSFLYGVSGSTSIVQLYRQLATTSVETPQFGALAKVGLVMLFAALGFRITIVPFHFYAPDVYQGTSHVNAGILAVVPKIAGIAALVRIGSVAMTGDKGYLQELASVGWHLAFALSIVTMTLGNLAALWQQNIRRLLAYSSIAHAGYLLIGLSVGMAVASGSSGTPSVDGIASTLFYLLVYSVATLGAFAALAYLGDGDRQVNNVDELAGLGRAHPWVAASIAIFMFSLTGLPPLAGFWGKLNLLTGALGVDSIGRELGGGLWPWFVALSLVAVLNAAISAAYYLRVIAVMYFRPALSVPPARGGAGAAAVALFCTVCVVGVGLNPGALMNTAQKASQAAQTTVVRPSAVEPPRVGNKRPSEPLAAAVDTATAGDSVFHGR